MLLCRKTILRAPPNPPPHRPPAHPGTSQTQSQTTPPAVSTVPPTTAATATLWLWVKPKKMSPSSPKTVTNRSPSSNRYAGRPATMETLICNVASSILALSIPALRAAWEGERLTEVSSSSGSVRSRSLSVSSGMLAYIITMPEANQTAIKGASRMPNQRCNRN